MNLEPVVLVRAFEGQPLRRIVIGVGRGVYYLANPDYAEDVDAGLTRGIGFPQGDCYVWDDASFEALARQYADLGSTPPDLWRDLTHFRDLSQRDGLSLSDHVRPQALRGKTNRRP